MDDRNAANEDRVPSVRLDVRLDRRPVSGGVRTERGAEERFVGWLDFVDALRRLDDLPAHATPPSQAGPAREPHTNPVGITVVERTTDAGRIPACQEVAA